MGVKSKAEVEKPLNEDGKVTAENKPEGTILTGGQKEGMPASNETGKAVAESESPEDVQPDGKEPPLGSDEEDKVATEGSQVKYTGKNPSYTIGKVRFVCGDVKEIDPEHLTAALASGKFERA